MKRRVAALRAQGTDVEYLEFADIAHGFGVGKGTSAAGWVGRATEFWKKHLARGAARRGSAGAGDCVFRSYRSTPRKVLSGTAPMSAVNQIP